MTIHTLYSVVRGVNLSFLPILFPLRSHGAYGHYRHTTGIYVHVLLRHFATDEVNLTGRRMDHGSWEHEKLL